MNPHRVAIRLAHDDLGRHELMGRYTQILIAQMRQSAACDAVHDVPVSY